MKRGIYKIDKFRLAANLFREGFSVRKVAKQLGLSNRTATTYRDMALGNQSVQCKCGLSAKHQGWCSWRIGQSKTRQKWLADCAAQSTKTNERIARERAAKAAEREALRQERLVSRGLRIRTQRARRVSVDPVTVNYPYFHTGSGDHGLVLRVNDQVPKTLPYQIRADVCQELLVAILSGEILETSICDRLPEFITRIINQQQDRWKEIPIDAPIHFQDGDAHTLADCMSAEDYADRLKNAWEANRLLVPRRKTYGTSISARRVEDNNAVTATTQIAGVGHRKMRSRIRHAGHTFAARRKNDLVKDQKMFAVQDYLARRIEEEQR